ncbi:MAG TPA: hypothetical protein VLB68_00885 [Pyrinomonadaceae bacterium]|nr:hypothetical protein [Pyrinomonadaceae bacterium]
MSSLKSKLGFVLVSLYVLVIAWVNVTDLGATGSMLPRNAMAILTLPGLILLIIPLKLAGVDNPGEGNNLTP